jgi:integrase
MTAYVFRPSRWKNGKLVQSRMYSGRYRRPGQTKITTVPLHVTDRDVAERKLRERIRDIEREEIGISVPKKMRVAAETALVGHIIAYCEDLRARRRASEHVATTERRLKKLSADCNWRRLIDVAPESFQTWRAKQPWAPKTLNDYRAAMFGLFAWLKKSGRVEENPMKLVEKAETRGNERRKRRAFTLEELGALVSVSGEYRLAILTDYYTGLRRNELAQVEWGDVLTSGDKTFVVVRASTTKNHEAKRCYLPSWFARELVQAKPQGAVAGERIFANGRIPSIWIFKSLLKRAGIPYHDGQGRQADFHALRKTLNTHLAQMAVDPQTRQEIMRHSDIALTLDVYTDKPMLPVAEAIEKLPVFLKQLQDAHPCAHNPDFSGHAASLGGAEKSGNRIPQTIQDEDRRQQLALTDTTEQNEEKSCLARTRT